MLPDASRLLAVLLFCSYCFGGGREHILISFVPLELENSQPLTNKQFLEVMNVANFH